MRHRFDWQQQQQNGLRSPLDGEMLKKKINPNFDWTEQPFNRQLKSSVGHSHSARLVLFLSSNHISEEIRDAPSSNTQHAAIFVAMARMARLEHRHEQFTLRADAEWKEKNRRRKKWKRTTRNKIKSDKRQDEKKSELQKIHRKINTFIFALTRHTIIATSLRRDQKNESKCYLSESEWDGERRRIRIKCKRQQPFIYYTHQLTTVQPSYRYRWLAASTRQSGCASSTTSPNDA